MLFAMSCITSFPFQIDSSTEQSHSTKTSNIEQHLTTFFLNNAWNMIELKPFRLEIEVATKGSMHICF